MRGNTDMTGVTPSKGFILAKEGIHQVEIVEVGEKYTKSGDPMPNVKMEVMNGSDAGAIIWDNIIIPKPGSSAEGIKGRTMHFLHVIGEPYEGDFTWNTDNWQGVKLFVRVKHEAPNDYHKGIRPIIAQYILADDLDQSHIPATTALGEEAVPF